MKLYTLQLTKRSLDYIDVEGSYIQAYRSATNGLQQQNALLAIKVRERQITEQELRVWNVSVEREYIGVTKQEIPFYKRKIAQELPTAFQWHVKEQEPLKLLPQNYTVIRHFKRFYKNDFYGHKGSFICKPCAEKVQGYIITQGASEETGKGGTVIVSFCFICENKYFMQSKNKKIKSMIGFAYRALAKEKVKIRQRGGARMTLDEQNGTDTEQVESTIRQRIRNITSLEDFTGWFTGMDDLPDNS